MHAFLVNQIILVSHVLNYFFSEYWVDMYFYLIGRLWFYEWRTLIDNSEKEDEVQLFDDLEEDEEHLFDNINMLWQTYWIVQHK
jgi:hypothetical protein